MKKNIFELEDTVYHPLYGEGVVKKTDFSIQSYFVRFYKGEGCYDSWFEEVHLSFESWPAPVHVRPFQAGWWVAKSRAGFGGDTLQIVYSSSKASGLIYCHYLGEKLPEEWNTEKGIV